MACNMVKLYSGFYLVPITKIRSMVSIQKIPINFLCHMEGMSYNIGPPINFHIVCAPVHCTSVERIFNLGSSEFWRFVSLQLNDYSKIIKYNTCFSNHIWPSIELADALHPIVFFFLVMSWCTNDPPLPHHHRPCGVALRALFLLV